jgi:hypothetical protein
VIDTLVAISHITQDAAAGAKARFSRLFAAAAEAARREHQLQDKSVALKAEAEVNTFELDCCSAS